MNCPGLRRSSIARRTWFQTVRLQLPLVDQPGSWAIKHQSRFECGGLSRLVVNVEADFACRQVLGGERSCRKPWDPR